MAVVLPWAVERPAGEPPQDLEAGGLETLHQAFPGARSAGSGGGWLFLEGHTSACPSASSFPALARVSALSRLPVGPRVPGALLRGPATCSGARMDEPQALSLTSDSALACAPSQAPVEARSVAPVSCGLEGSRAEAVRHILPGAMLMGSNSGGVTWPPKAQKPLVLRGRAAGPALGQVTRDGAPAPRKVTQGRGLKWVTGTWAPECAGPAATVRTGLPSGQEGRPGEGFEQRISLAGVRYRWEGTGEDQVGCGGLDEKGVQDALGSLAGRDGPFSSTEWSPSCTARLCHLGPREEDGNGHHAWDLPRVCAGAAACRGDQPQAWHCGPAGLGQGHAVGWALQPAECDPASG